MGGLRGLAEQRDFVDGAKFLDAALHIERAHQQRMHDGDMRGRQPFAQAVERKIVHQEADGAAMHAVDRLARHHVLVQGLQHQPVAAERHDHVGFGRIGVAVARLKLPKGLARLRRLAGDEGDMLEIRGLPAHGKGPTNGTRGARLYDLAIDCRGGAGRARHRRTAAGGLRQYPAGHDFALLVGG